MPVEVSYLLAELPPEPQPEPGPEPSYGVLAYARQLRDLLPRGLAWVAESGSWLAKVLLAIAEELARVDGRVHVLLQEQDPRTAVETLQDWERVLGLPDGSGGTSPEELGERQLAAAQRLLSRGGQSRAFFVAMAAALGCEGATIEEFPAAQLRVGFRAGDRCTGEGWAHAWLIHLPDVPEPRRQFFEATIRRAAPAHSTVVFSYA